ncbi:hypothetical protein HZB93_01980 [Candidatus Falkowbacteria bacterium]|nr:hypothetical protein [Candidatus Falkowbacteria bacterium]
MGESTQPGTPKLYHITIYRPSDDPKAPDLKVPVGSGRFLFTDLPDGQVSSDATARKNAEKLREVLPQGWELKITEVPFTVTRGTPALIGTCSRATCKNFGKPTTKRFHCSECGEPLSFQMIATE